MSRGVPCIQPPCTFYKIFAQSSHVRAKYLLGLDRCVGYSEKCRDRTTWKVGYSITTFPFNASATVIDLSILKKLNLRKNNNKLSKNFLSMLS